ncbi:MAG: GNAT family N-acetyltransferase [Planctomycetes bacterium]|nr:GNAT family N-acetyltransferase [Planctomycetota bacterium]
MAARLLGSVMSGRTNVDIRQVQAGDAAALAAFYNSLGPQSIRNFRPLGEKTSAGVCAKIVKDNDPDRCAKFDLIAISEGRIVGWCFLWDIQTGAAKLGLAVADDHQHRGLGSTLMGRVMAVARRRGCERITLTVVKDNQIALRLYENHGFVRQNEFVSDTDGLTYFRMTCDPGSDSVVREQNRKYD